MAISTSRRASSKKTSSGTAARGKSSTKSAIEAVLANQHTIIALVRTHMKEILDSVLRLLDLLKAFWRGEYKALPYWTIAMILAPLAYLLSPVDVSPDFIPGIGYLDDAAFLALVLRLVGKDLETYEAWKAARSKGKRKAAGRSKARAKTAASRVQVRAA